MGPPFISFLSDYGLEDEFVGVCHGVIARRCPEARVIDITHAVPRQDVRTGALILRDALAHMPVGVHLAVVDPTVGHTGERRRRAVALRPAAEGQLLVGPDNGLLRPALEWLGGALEAVEISSSPERLEPVSATFHGRDLFAPVAAALAAGAPLRSLGDELPVAGLCELALPQSRVEDDVLIAHVLRVDHFGNVILDASGEQLDAAGLRIGEPVWVEAREHVHRGLRTVAFADVARGELLLYEDSLPRAALAVNRGSAAALLGVAPDEQIAIRRAA